MVLGSRIGLVIGLSGILVACTDLPPEYVGSSGGQTSSETDTTDDDETSNTPDGTAGSGGSDTGVMTGSAEGSTTSSTTTPAEDESDDAGWELGCEEIFGDAKGYELCEATEDTCAFNLFTGNNSCNAICAHFDEMCMGALDNPGPGDNPCEVQGESSCDNNDKGTTICVCSWSAADK